MKKYIFIIVVCLGFINCRKNLSSQNNSCVKDEASAIKIAKNKWIKGYGKKILSEKPFKAHLVNDSIWVVEGTLHTQKGGVAYLEINARNCEILKVSHGK